jgi:hypothetical protein
VSLPAPVPIPVVSLDAARTELAAALGLCPRPGASVLVEPPPSIHIAATWPLLSDAALASANRLRLAGLGEVAEQIQAAGVCLHFAAGLDALGEDGATDGTRHLAALHVYAACLHLRHALALHPALAGTVGAAA